jgi:uncharacterized protein (TIGR00299 family) protein
VKVKTLYLDCISGISGDMTLAALIDLGADLAYIERHLRELPIDPFEMWTETVVKRGITARKLRLRVEKPRQDHHHHHHRRAADILAMIDNSGLPPKVKRRSRAIFRAIAESEGKIHGTGPEEVHFHEVGAMDSILDIVGVCLALENLAIEEVYASPVPAGYGKVRMAHGLYPIPAPATADLLVGLPLSDWNAEGELTTPTGAAILKTLVKGFGPLRSMTIQRIGYGAGEKDFDHPNVLRAMLVGKTPECGERRNWAFSEAVDASGESEEAVAVLEAQLDDITGEALGYAMDRLFASGALDVFYTPVYMKKNRPGTLLTVLVLPESADRCERTLLLETTTLGVRRAMWTRRKLERRVVSVETPYGPVRLKQAFLGEVLVRQMPEYEDVAEAARRAGVPFHQVYQAALHARPDGDK